MVAPMGISSSTVASPVGDIAVPPDGKPSVHVHSVLGGRYGTTLAGHQTADCAEFFMLGVVIVT